MDLLHILLYKRRMLGVSWPCIRHLYRRSESGMDLDIFHEHMQDGQDIQDLSCIQVSELKWKNVQIYTFASHYFATKYFYSIHLRSIMQIILYNSFYSVYLTFTFETSPYKIEKYLRSSQLVCGFPM